MKRKISRCLLVFIMVFTMIPSVAFAEFSTDSVTSSTISDAKSTKAIIAKGVSGDIEWVIYEDGLMILSGNGEFASTNCGGFQYDKNGEEYFLPAIKPTWIKYQDKITKIKVQVSGCTNMTDLFGRHAEYPKLKEVDFTGSDTSNVISFEDMFFDKHSLETVNMGNLNVSNVISMWAMFHGCNSLKNISLDGWDTENVTNAGYMFTFCRSLEDFEDVEKFNFSNAVDLCAFFSNCTRAKQLDLRAWNCKKIEIAYDMFFKCSNLTNLNLANWDVKNLKEAWIMFSECKKLKNLNISNWDFRGMENCDSMFKQCSSLESIEIPKGLKKINMCMVYDCPKLKTLIIPVSVEVIDEFSIASCNNLEDILYTGTKKQWNKIKIGSDNYSLEYATVKYSYKPCKSHSYKTTTTKATPLKNGKTVKKCEICGDIDSSTTIYRPNKIKMSVSEYTYNGKQKKPTVKVYNSNGKLISSDQYKVTYAKGRTKVGKYKVTVTFKDSSKKYKGSFSTTFKIKPVKTSIRSLTKGAKSFTVKWSKKTTQVTGYQIMYATDKKFTKNKKTVTVKNYKTTSKKITGLKAKKTYYVKVRTYKTVDGKKYYSDWSGYKTVKTL